MLLLDDFFIIISIIVEISISSIVSQSIIFKINIVDEFLFCLIFMEL